MQLNDQHRRHKSLSHCAPVETLARRWLALLANILERKPTQMAGKTTGQDETQNETEPAKEKISRKGQMQYVIK